MNRFIMIGALIALALVALPTVHGDADAGNMKVGICHATPVNIVWHNDLRCAKECRGANSKLRWTGFKYTLIKVAPSAVAAHKAHGDRLLGHKFKVCPSGKLFWTCECNGGGSD